MVRKLEGWEAGVLGGSNASELTGFIALLLPSFLL
jgi:hypothetical protein